MSDYFGNLAARALGLTVTARPRPSFFEPRRDAVEPMGFEERAAPIVRRAPPVPSRQGPVDPAPEPGQEPDQEERHALEAGLDPAEPPGSRPQQRRSKRFARKTRVEPLLTRLAAGRRKASAPLPPPETVELRAEVVPEAPPPARTIRAERAPPLLAARLPRGVTEAKESEPPTVRVTIGRVDVRAVTPAEPPVQKPKRRPAPRMSLDEYLSRERSNGR